MSSEIADFLEQEKPGVMMVYKQPENDIESLLEEFPDGETFVVGDLVRNYSIGTLEDIAERTIGEDYFYGVRNMLPNDKPTDKFEIVRNPEDLDNRTDLISDIVVEDIMVHEPDSEVDIVYVLDDVDNSLGFNNEKTLFQYAHSMTGRFMSVEGDSILLANEEYDGILRNLATTEYDLMS